MNNYKTLFLAIIFTIPSLIACSQSYKIDVEITDLKDTEVYLGYYYGEKTYVKDTILLDSNGKGTFEGDSLLDQGMYLVVMPNKNYFDVLIGGDQEFSLSTNSVDLVKGLKIKGSKENLALNEFQNFMTSQNKKVVTIQNRLKEQPAESDSIDILKNEVDILSNEVKEYWNKTIAENQDNFLGVLVKAMQNPEIPEIDIPDDVQNKDSVRWFHSYNYNRAHYFDNIDFTDARLIRTPIFHNKLNTFYTKILIQDPDTLTNYIDKVAIVAEESEEMFEYVIRYFLNTFSSSNIMGMDKVFVHVAENYYLTDKVDWLDEETLQKIKDQVAKHKFNLIGNVAQDLKMETINGEYARLHDIHAKYTLVYFWEPNCGHCKKVTPEIYKLYQEFSRDEFEIMAVYTQTDKEEWTKYIEEKGYDEWINAWDPYNLTNFRFFYNIYSTPTIYLLDENKKIIAKRIGHETLRNILEIEFGMKDISKVIEEEKKRN